MDNWSGYRATRDRLVGSIDRAGLGNIVFLSGDVYSHWAANVPRQPEAADGEPVAVEFTTTSITSGGDGSDVAPYWHRIADHNPQVRFHTARRGYLASTVSREEWRADFRTVDTVRYPHGRLRTAASMTVERGRPLLHAS